MTMPAFWILPLAIVTLIGAQAGPPRAAQSQPKAKEVRNSLGMRLVEIPGGSFDMGSTVGPGEAPVHRVSVRSFWMGVTEVTQAQWQAVMGNNPSHFKQAGPDAPVEMVGWDEAQAFVRKLNEREPGWRYRLPSEAEWEYACLAGTAKDPYGAGRGDRVDQGELGRHHAPGRLEAAERLRPLRHVRQRAGMDAGHAGIPTTRARPPTGAPGKAAAPPITRFAGAAGTFPRSSCTPPFAGPTARFTAGGSASRLT